MVKVMWFRFQKCLVPLTFCFPIVPLKIYFLEIFLTTFFGTRNFENASAMKVIFIRNCSKFNMRFMKSRNKFRKCFLFLR